MPDEEWRPILGYEELYEVSSFGQVRRLKTINGSQTGLIRTPQPTHYGYFALTLSKGGERRAYLLHGLVAEAFLGPRPGNMCVNHKDGNKRNNRVDNLEYVTVAENYHHAVRLGLFRPARGQDHSRAKLTNADVWLIRRELAEGTTPVEIAQQFGVGVETIRLIRSGKAWRHLSDNGLQPSPTAPQGEPKPPRKLTDSAVHQIHSLREAGVPVKAIARQFAVCRGTIYRIIAQSGEKHIP